MENETVQAGAEQEEKVSEEQRELQKSPKSPKLKEKLVRYGFVEEEVPTEGQTL